MEIFKDIKGYGGVYKVSTNGNILSNKKRTRLLMPQNRNKYLMISLCLNGIKTVFSLHRLVATTFIPNPKNKPQVNHINGIKTDNRVENLEWCTSSENHLHAFKSLNRKHFNTGKYGENCHSSKSIEQYDLQGNFIKSFVSMKQASDELNIRPYNISNCCRGKYKTSKGFIFKLKNN